MSWPADCKKELRPRGVAKEVNPVFAERMLVVRTVLGVHIVAAKRLVELARRYEAEIELYCNGQQADAKSILGVLTLAASRGAQILVRASGRDAQAAVQALGRLAETNFGEGAGRQMLN